VAPIDLVPNAGENAMQHSRLCLSFIVTVAMIGAVERNFVFAQTEVPSQTPVPATPRPAAALRGPRSVQVDHRHGRPAANEAMLGLRRAVGTGVVSLAWCE